MKKCIVVGKFAFGSNIIDGQTVKSITIYEEMEERYGIDSVDYIDTYEWKKKKINTFCNVIKAFKNSNNVLMLPAHNGVRVFAPLFSVLKKIYKRKIHYIVIGSWLYEKVKSSSILKKTLLTFDNIFVETTKLNEELSEFGFKNVVKMNNYKKLEVIDAKSIKPFNKKNVLKICIFSRINKEKGIVDAINVVNEMNRKKITINLDIYGMIESDFESEFNTLISKCDSHIKYKGLIMYNKSVETISKYDLLLFPTKYFTEGIPGTIIDSYAAGVPVLSSMWKNYKDIIINNVTGKVFKMNDIEDLQNQLYYIYNNQRELYNMKKNCIEQAQKYCSGEALLPLFNAIEE